MDQSQSQKKTCYFFKMKLRFPLTSYTLGLSECLAETSIIRVKCVDICTRDEGKSSFGP